MTGRSALGLAVRWALAFAVTESVMVAIASLTVATTYAGIAVCGIAEGAVLGVLQGSVLFGRRPRPVAAWIAATVAGMLAGRLVEFGADASPLAATLLTASVTVQVLAGAVLGAGIGAVSGVFQAFALPHEIRAPYRWIVVCAASWALTLPALLVVGRLIADASALPIGTAALIVVTLFAGVGALLGLLQGAGLGWMRRGDAPAAVAHGAFA